MAYALGPVKPHVKAAANELGTKFAIGKVYGYANRKIAGTNTLSDHAKGLALDFMVPTTDVGKAIGESLAQYAVQNADRLGITYIIWYRRIWKASTGTWTKYGGVSPHTDHVHISFKPLSNYKGPVAGLVDKAVDQVNPLDNVVKALEFYSDPNNWKRLALFIAGIVLLVVGIWNLTKPSVGKVVNNV